MRKNQRAIAAIVTVATAAGFCGPPRPAAAQELTPAPPTPERARGGSAISRERVIPAPAAPTTPAESRSLPGVPAQQRTQGVQADSPRLLPQDEPGLRDTASSKTTITSDAISSANSQTSSDALRDVPGLSSNDARGSGTAESLQVRGIKLNSSTSYRLDGGLPLTNNIILVLDDKQQVQALKGAGALQFGLASAGGLINYTMKRAGDTPNTSLQTQFNSNGQMIGVVDVGGRFGPNKQLGLRVVTSGGELGSFVRSAGGTRYQVGVAADWTPSNRFSVIVDYERFGIDVIEQAPILLLPANGANYAIPSLRNRISLPAVPDPKAFRAGTWSHSIGYGENIFTRARVDLGSGFEVIAEGGRSIAFRNKRSPTQIGNYDIVTGLGIGSATLIKNQLAENRYANLEAHYTSTLAEWAENVIVAGATYNARDNNGVQNQNYRFAQNIYNPFPPPEPQVCIPPAVTGCFLSADRRAYLPNNSDDYDFFIRDQIDLFDRVHLFAGIRRVNYEAISYKSTGAIDTAFTRFDAPGFGGVVDVTKMLSIYASYVKSLDETGQAPVNAANAFDVLPPAPAKQKEAGVKLKFENGTNFTLGWFNINRANATIDRVTNIYSLNGTVDYEGAEMTAIVPLPYSLIFNAGAQYIHSTQMSKDASIAGKTPENIPVWSGSTGLTWRPSFAPGLRLNVGMSAASPREGNPQNQVRLPGFMIFNAGANYATTLYGHRSALSLTATNLTNNRYWSSVSSGALAIGAPLTVALSLRTEL